MPFELVWLDARPDIRISSTRSTEYTRDHANTGQNTADRTCT